MYQATGIIGPAARRADHRGQRGGGRLPRRRRQLPGDAGRRIGDPAPAAASHATVRQSVRSAIAEGLRFVRSNNALSGSFAIDLVAMTFGMPRALFAVLSLTVYHAGASGTGLMYAGVSAGGTLAVLTSGWVGHARRLGRIVIGCVLVWGAAIALLGVVRTIAAGDRAADDRRLRRRGQRVLPLDDQPDGDPRCAARPDERGLQPGGDQRPAARRHRVGARGRR